jgi:two-component system nitrate/nitrite response regulator NarL
LLGNDGPTERELFTGITTQFDFVLITRQPAACDSVADNMGKGGSARRARGGREIRVRRARAASPDWEGPILLVATPKPRLRKRWRQALQRRVGVFEVANRADLERALVKLRPSVLLVDIELCGPGGPGGPRGVLSLLRLSPTAKIVLLANRSQNREAVAALKAGARGYCPSDIAPNLLRKAVDRLEQGELWIGRDTAAGLLDELTALTELRRKELGAIRASSRKDDARLSALTGRERQIARLVASGVTNKDIATRLGLSEKTVKGHLTLIFRKLDLSSRVQVALLVAAP